MDGWETILSFWEDLFSGSMLVLAGVVVSSTFPLLRGSGATQTRGMIQNEVQCARLNLFECEDYVVNL